MAQAVFVLSCRFDITVSKNSCLGSEGNNQDSNSLGYFFSSRDPKYLCNSLDFEQFSTYLDRN